LWQCLSILSYLDGYLGAWESIPPSPIVTPSTTAHLNLRPKRTGLNARDEGMMDDVVASLRRWADDLLVLSSLNVGSVRQRFLQQLAQHNEVRLWQQNLAGLVGNKAVIDASN
jgi:hypothetical protein